MEGLNEENYRKKLLRKGSCEYELLGLRVVEQSGNIFTGGIEMDCFCFLKFN